MAGTPRTGTTARIRATPWVKRSPQARTRRSGEVVLNPRGRPSGRGDDGLRLGGLDWLGGRPAADDVPHGEQTGHVVAFDHDEVPEPAPDHRLGGPFQGPVGRG